MQVIMLCLLPVTRKVALQFSSHQGEAQDGDALLQSHEECLRASLILRLSDEIFFHHQSSIYPPLAQLLASSQSQIPGFSKYSNSFFRLLSNCYYYSDDHWSFRIMLPLIMKVFALTVFFVFILYFKNFFMIFKPSLCQVLKPLVFCLKFFPEGSRFLRHRNHMHYLQLDALLLQLQHHSLMFLDPPCYLFLFSHQSRLSHTDQRGFFC